MPPPRRARSGSGGGSSSSAAATAASDAGEASTAERIEALVGRAVRRLAAGEDPTIDLPGFAGLCSSASGGGGAGVSFAGARDLASLLRAVRTSYELLASGRTATSREVYYLHATYYARQDEANTALKAAAGVLGVARHEMGVLAASRGWYAGLVRVREAAGGATDDGSDSDDSRGEDGSGDDYYDGSGSDGVDGEADDGEGDAGGSGDDDESLEDLPRPFRAAAVAAAVPRRRKRRRRAATAPGPPRPVPGEAVYSDMDGAITNAGARYILVVEKECIFRRLVEDAVWARVPCVLVTGCGFPDLATRAFVYRLHTALRLPVLGLSDWNPFGLAIMACYRNGSRSMPEANAFTVPLRWLGLRHDDLEAFALPPSALQPMTAHDEARAGGLLRDPAIADDDGWAYEAGRFLARREKMELEGVLGRGLGFLAHTYVPSKVDDEDWV
jgi:DNA topoisomerase VI subunit A